MRGRGAPTPAEDATVGGATAAPPFRRVGLHRTLFYPRSATSARDAVCVLTHDAKFDVPAIVHSLPTRVGYLGAMGSRTTHERRAIRLREEGVTDEELARIRAPIGIDIGGRTPEETAVSIVAEIIALRTGHAAPSLTDGRGSIH